MATDDEAARKARAKALREQIDKVKQGGAAPAPATGGVPPTPAPETPAEFVHRRMRELDKGDKK